MKRTERTPPWGDDIPRPGLVEVVRPDVIVPPVEALPVVEVPDGACPLPPRRSAAPPIIAMTTTAVKTSAVLRESTTVFFDAEVNEATDLNIDHGRRLSRNPSPEAGDCVGANGTTVKVIVKSGEAAQPLRRPVVGW